MVIQVRIPWETRYSKESSYFWTFWSLEEDSPFEDAEVEFSAEVPLLEVVVKRQHLIRITRKTVSS